MGRVRIVVKSAEIAAAFIAVVVGLRYAEAAQNPRDVTRKPTRLSSSARIAPADEPGTPLVISGRVVGTDGKVPLRNVVVYAYHTDNRGYYRSEDTPTEQGESNPRLEGWVKTDALGYFQFATIRPAPYPNRAVPAHIHVHAWGAGYPRQWFEIEFDKDPLVSKQHFSDKTAEYLYVVPVERGRGGVEHCSVTIRLRERSNF